MSDRVLIPCGTDTARDWFPVPNQAIDLGATAHGDYTAYPFAVDRDTMMKWYYIVRKWEFNLAISYDIYNDLAVLVGSNSGTLFANLFMTTAAGGAMTREAQLAEAILGWSVALTGSSGASGAGYDSLSWDFPTDITEDTGSEGGTGLNVISTFNIVRRYGSSLFYPNFQLDFGTGDGDGGSQAITEGDLSALESSLTFGALTIPISYQAGATFGEGTRYLFTSITASILPVLYWAHKNLAGNPVYDTSTGAVINPIT